MSWFTAIVVYVLIWWTVLFAVLPFGTRPVDTPDPLTGWRGAPVRVRLGRILLATTLIAALFWGIAMALIGGNWLSFRHGILAMPKDYTSP